MNIEEKLYELKIASLLIEYYEARRKQICNYFGNLLWYGDTNRPNPLEFSLPEELNMTLKEFKDKYVDYHKDIAISLILEKQGD